MEVIEVRVRQEDEVDRRKIGEFQSRSPQPLQEKQPIGKVRIDQDVEIRELNQEGGMTDPRDGDLSVRQLWKDRFLGCPRAPRQQRLPYHVMEKRPGIEVIARREIAK
jgi:hypothetical protein